MKLAFLFALALSSAEAIKPLNGLKPTSVLRGGGAPQKTTDELILTASAATAALSGALIFLDKGDIVNKWIFFGLNECPTGNVETAMMLGWAAGKVNALQSGAASIKNFCKLNLVPMVAWLVKNLQDDSLDMSANIFPGVFIAAYSYVAFN
jgi:hypothetical protein